MHREILSAPEAENQSPHRALSGGYYGIVGRCLSAVVRNNGQCCILPLRLQRQLDVEECLAHALISHVI